MQLLAPATRVALQDVTDRKDADRREQELKHLVRFEVSGVGELCDDGQRRYREANQLKKSSDRVHGQHRTTARVWLQAGWRRRVAVDIMHEPRGHAYGGKQIAADVQALVARVAITLPDLRSGEDLPRLVHHA